MNKLLVIAFLLISVLLAGCGGITGNDVDIIKKEISKDDDNKLTGKSITQTAVMSCYDDDGFNINRKGIVVTNMHGKKREYPDRCEGGQGNRILENYCDGDRRYFTYEWCLNNKKCVDGRCI